MHAYKLFLFRSIYFPIIIEFPSISPIVVAIWCGISKPPLNEYLQPFVAEMKLLMSNGITINAHKIEIKIGRIICDTPARAFLKGK